MKITNSLKLVRRASKVIPGQTSTVSKRYGRLPQGVAPAYLSHGNLCRIWDVDGNEYIDWSAALGAVILGYNYFKDIFKPANSMSLSTEIEIELAEKLVDTIPCAEMVRFFKTGSDACTAAVQLAYYIKGHCNFAYTGYHGWTIGEDCYRVQYGDLETLESIFQYGVNCYILEPIDRSCPELFSDVLLKKIRRLCNKYKVILVFDEVLTGFRYKNLTEVKPDLACYGKAMSNGKAISVLVGKKELMKEMSNMRISGTFYTDPEPMYYALETIKFIEENDVLNYIEVIGESLKYEIRELIEHYGLDDACHIKGFGPWNSIEWHEGFFDEQQLFLQEIFKRGIFYNRDHFAMFSHTKKEINETLKVYSEVFDYIVECRRKGINGLESWMDKSLFPK